MTIAVVPVRFRLRVHYSPLFSFQIDYPKFPSWAFVVLGIPFIINILGILLPNQTIVIEIAFHSN